MTDTQITVAEQAETAVQARLKDLEEENELLLLQLHQVQEELESYFLKCRELERSGGSLGTVPATAGGWVDDELPAMQAEVSRLTTLVETQTRLHDIASKNALNARLGDILIQSVSPGGSLMGLPARLLAIWRASTADQPPARLGGKNFDKVIETFQTGGLESVSQLLAAEPAPEMRAKAWTALARHQMKNGLFADAALSARRAYEEEPKPYRLKWLAFRLHDAGEIEEADACLSLLPQDTPFSDSEGRQRDQVRYEANNARLREANHKTGFEARRQAMESQMQTLRQERDKHARLAVELEDKVRSQLQTQGRLEAEMAVLARKQEESANLLVTREIEIDSLREVTSRLEQETLVLTEKLEESRKLFSAQEVEYNSLKLVKSRVEQQVMALHEERQESAKLFAVHKSEIESFREVKCKLQREIMELLEKQDELGKLFAIRESEVDSLRQVKIQLEQEIMELTQKQQDYKKLLAARETEFESLQQVMVQLEQELATLKKTIENVTHDRNELTQLAQERLSQISEMERLLEERKVAESELEFRQQLLREEMARAEAQLDLMKDILLRESGL